jgi:hypothetical protein
VPQRRLGRRARSSIAAKNSIRSSGLAHRVGAARRLGAYSFPGDVVVGVRQRLTRAPLDLAGPRCFHVGLGLVVQAGEQICNQRGVLGDRQVHRVTQ